MKASVGIFGVDHKMGHNAGNKFPTVISTHNDRTYFSLLKFHHKVANVMIKPVYSIFRIKFNGWDQGVSLYFLSK